MRLTYWVTMGLQGLTTPDRNGRASSALLANWLTQGPNPLPVKEIYAHIWTHDKVLPHQWGLA